MSTPTQVKNPLASCPDVQNVRKGGWMNGSDARQRAGQAAAEVKRQVEYAIAERGNTVVYEDHGAVRINGYVPTYDVSPDTVKVGLINSYPNGKLHITVGGYGERKTFRERAGGLFDTDGIVKAILKEVDDAKEAQERAEAGEVKRSVAAAQRLVLEQEFWPDQVNPSDPFESVQIRRGQVELEASAAGLRLCLKSTVTPEQAKAILKVLREQGLT